MGRELRARTNMVTLVLISGSLVTKVNRFSSPAMLRKCFMYLTLQRTTSLWFFPKK
jgi:hypothetical protein